MRNLFGLFICTWILSCHTVLYGQITAAVTLTNFDSAEPIFMVTSLGEKVLAPAEGTFAQILARPVGTQKNFRVLVSAVGEDTFEFVVAGYFDGGVTPDVPDVPPDATGEFIVRAWRGAAGWAEARQNPAAFVGKSPVFVNATGSYTGGAPTPDLLPAALKVPSFVLRPVPEPLSWMLFLFGISLILTFKRRG